MLSIAPELSHYRQKILLGLNFYGYDFTSSGMDGTANRNKHCLLLCAYITIMIYLSCAKVATIIVA